MDMKRPYNRQLKPAISINILRFSFLPTEDPFSKYVVYDVKHQHQLSNDLELDFLEIPKYKAKPVREMSRMERWLAYFANKLNKQEKEELAMLNPEIAEAMDASERYLMDEAAYREYLQRESAIWDYNNDINGSREEGYAAGIAEVTEKVIRNQLKRGADYAQIAADTETSIEEVARVAKKYGMEP